jgi:hypothetical protein
MDKCKLHLGCGTRRPPGYINIDIRDDVEPDVVANVHDLSDFNGVDEIYFCHGLEHIPRPEIDMVLQEWYRVLIPGGVLRLSVPDFAVLARLYIHEGVLLERLLGPLHGGQNYEGNLHYCSYDYETLALCLSRNGFIDIHRYDPKEVFPAGYDDFSFARINEKWISLNVMSTKV